MENCKATGSVVGNTFFEHDEERLVTYYGLGTCPNESITVEGFSQIDHYLVHKNTLGKIVDVWSDRSPSYFLIQILANIGFDCLPLPEKPKTYCFSGKIHTGTKHKDYCAQFCQHATKVTVDVCLNERANIISEAMHVAAEECYTKGAYARKPWVSQEVLQLIKLRQDAKKTNNYEREQELHKQIKRTVKDGRKN